MQLRRSTFCRGAADDDRAKDEHHHIDRDPFRNHVILQGPARSAE
jgi:hypothetical protein